MSGGFFDYNQYRINEIADQIGGLLSNNPYGYSPETLDEFRTAVRALQIARIYAQRIDWLVCDDDGEATFHTRLRQDLEE